MDANEQNQHIKELRRKRFMYTRHGEPERFAKFGIRNTQMLVIWYYYTSREDS